MEDSREDVVGFQQDGMGQSVPCIMRRQCEEPVLWNESVANCSKAGKCLHAVLVWDACGLGCEPEACKFADQWSAKRHRIFRTVQVCMPSVHMSTDARKVSIQTVSRISLKKSPRLSGRTCAASSCMVNFPGGISFDRALKSFERTRMLPSLRRQSFRKRSCSRTIGSSIVFVLSNCSIESS